jgi:peptidoglycan-associated lipoprotein
MEFIMNLFTKSFAVLSAVFLLAACDSLPGTSGSQNSAGGMGTGGPVTPGTQSDLAQNVGDRVFFDYDSALITADSQRTLEKQAAWLKQYSSVKVTVEGHCDERGTREYNLALGERRAAAAKKYLVGLGIAASRVSTISYGKERPAVIGSDESAWGQNRRAVTVVTNQ